MIHHVTVTVHDATTRGAILCVIQIMFQFIMFDLRPNCCCREARNKYLSNPPVGQLYGGGDHEMELSKTGVSTVPSTAIACGGGT